MFHPARVNGRKYKVQLCWGKKEGMGQEDLKDREMEQKKVPIKSAARPRQESQKRRRRVTIFSVGSRDLRAHKTGLFPLIRGSSCTPGSPPALRTLNHTDIYADTKTSHFFAGSISIPSPAIVPPPTPFPASLILLHLLYNSRDAGSLRRKVKYIIDFHSLSRFALSLSTSPHLSGSTSSSCLWGERLSTSSASSSYVCLASRLHTRIHLRVSLLLLNSQATHLNHTQSTILF